MFCAGVKYLLLVVCIVRSGFDFLGYSRIFFSDRIAKYIVDLDTFTRLAYNVKKFVAENSINLFPNLAGVKKVRYLLDFHREYWYRYMQFSSYMYNRKMVGFVYYARWSAHIRYSNAFLIETFSILLYVLVSYIKLSNNRVKNLISSSERFCRI